MWLTVDPAEAAEYGAEAAGYDEPCFPAAVWERSWIWTAADGLCWREVLICAITGRT